MNRLSWSLGLLLGLLTSGGSGAATDSSEQRKQPADERPLGQLKILKLDPSYKASIRDCDADGPDACVVEVDFLPVAGTKKYCVAIAPNVSVKTVTGGGANRKNLVWRLSRSSLDGLDLKFHADSGIVITIDHPTNKQIDPKGGHGDGKPNPPNPPSEITYHVKTKRDELGANAGYLPVVIWGTGLTAELCAAVDPKIGNN